MKINNRPTTPSRHHQSPATTASINLGWALMLLPLAGVIGPALIVAEIIKERENVR